MIYIFTYINIISYWFYFSGEPGLIDIDSVLRNILEV